MKILSNVQFLARQGLPLRGDGEETDSNFTGILFPNPNDYYRKSYFEAIDFIISSIQERFDQPGYRMYKNIESNH